nr:uncharacterized protein LOC123758963 [Procambarus clarkii]
MSITRGGFMFVQYSFGFPLDSSLRPAVDLIIYRLKELGLLEKLLQSGTGNTTYCLQPPGRENLSDLRTLAVGDFLGVFTLYAAGMVACVAAFLLEVVWGRRPPRASQVTSPTNHLANTAEPLFD